VESKGAPKKPALEVCARCIIDVCFGPGTLDLRSREVSKPSSARRRNASSSPRREAIATAIRVGRILSTREMSSTR